MLVDMTYHELRLVVRALDELRKHKGEMQEEEIDMLLLVGDRLDSLLSSLEELAESSWDKLVENDNADRDRT